MQPQTLMHSPLRPAYNHMQQRIDRNRLKRMNRFTKSAFIHIPQCKKRMYWSLSIEDTIDTLLQVYPIDQNRIYLIEVSMGGGGAWEYAQNNPDRYAALIPICGLTNPAEINIPMSLALWAFHSFDDPTVKIELTTNPILSKIFKKI